MSLRQTKKPETTVRTCTQSAEKITCEYGGIRGSTGSIIKWFFDHDVNEIIMSIMRQPQKSCYYSALLHLRNLRVGIYLYIYVVCTPGPWCPVFHMVDSHESNGERINTLRRAILGAMSWRWSNMNDSDKAAFGIHRKRELSVEKTEDRRKSKCFLMQ